MKGSSHHGVTSRLLFAWSDIREIVPFFPFVPCVSVCALSNAHAYTAFSAVFPLAWRNLTSARPSECSQRGFLFAHVFFLCVCCPFKVSFTASKVLTCIPAIKASKGSSSLSLLSCFLDLEGRCGSSSSLSASKYLYTYNKIMKEMPLYNTNFNLSLPCLWLLSQSLDTSLEVWSM